MQQASNSYEHGSTVTDQEILEVIVNCGRGSVIAPAGCGKTEMIARSALHSQGRRLILTHTLAGVDAVRARLKSIGAHPGNHEVSTIASWSLRLATAFPIRSGLSLTMPNGNEWEAVYAAAAQLIADGYITSVITSSYGGVLVDEYQDCTQSQHQIIDALANVLPCCIFGDTLQAIFGFRKNQIPDWDGEVLRAFPTVAKLNYPHRWDKVGNKPLGDWLLDCRNQLLGAGQIDLATGPSSVRHCKLTEKSRTGRYLEKARLVTTTLAARRGEKCIVIGDSKNENSRARLARTAKAAAIEPVSCKKLSKFAADLETAKGPARLSLVLALVKAIMLKGDVACLQKTAINVADGKRHKPLNDVETACVEISRSQDLRPILHLLERIPQLRRGWIYRRELYSALCWALRDVIARSQPTLADAVWDVQNRRRHAGRRFANRSVGSTLLVKGLEFDHAIIVDVETLKRNDLYVALTRGSRSVTVISESPIVRPCGT